MLAGAAAFFAWVAEADADPVKAAVVVPQVALTTNSSANDRIAESGRRELDESCYGGEDWRLQDAESSDEEARRIRDLKAWESFRDCAECPEMKLIPAGEFEMGVHPSNDGKKSDEAPRHRVTIRSFAISKYELEWAAFERFVKTTRRVTDNSCRVLGEGNVNMENWIGLNWRLPGYVQRPNHPAVCVSWNDAQAYVRWLSAQTGKRYRLLSEAEWEYAARAKSIEAEYWSGQEEFPACSFGNFADQTSHDDFSWKESFQCSDHWWLPSPVGIYRPNPFGVYDMLGNLWEWVEDCANPDYESASGEGRPSTCGDCGRRMIRGASWSTKPSAVRFGNRARAATNHRSVNIGIRVARDLE